MLRCKSYATPTVKMGQNLSCRARWPSASVRSGHTAQLRYVPTTDVSSCKKGRVRRLGLFDQLVCLGQQRWGYGEAQRLGGFEVYSEFKLGRLRNWQIGRFFALEDTAGVDTSLPQSIKIARPIAHKTADFHGLGPGVNRWHGMAGPPGGRLVGGCEKRKGGGHPERAGSQ